MVSITLPVRTGTHAIGFNAVGDWIRTPQIANPGVLSFWYRRSSNTTAWTLNIQTSPDGTTWTTRASITTITATYTQYSFDIGALGLTNVFIRLRDSRASGSHERYIDDLALTSTTTTNTLLPILGSCSQTLNSTLTYRVVDDGGPAGPISAGYSNSIDRTVTLTPSDNTLKLNLAFTQMDLETSYDYLYVYDGPSTASTLLATINGTTLPSDITATNSLGQLTLRWTTDISNLGTWGGFAIDVTSISSVALPVELTQFYGIAYPRWNNLIWTTASEHNSSHYVVERSTDGSGWKQVGQKPAAVNSNHIINYSYVDMFQDPTINYYRLIQYDMDGAYRIYDIIALDNRVDTKKVIKCINLLGQEVDPYTARGVLLEVYEDGTTNRVIR